MNISIGFQAVFVTVADEIDMVEFGFVAVGLQSIHPGDSLQASRLD